MKDEKYKILYVTSSDPSKRTSWSGVLFSINMELNKYFDVDNLILPVYDGLISKIYNKLIKLITGKETLPAHTVRRAKKSSRKLERTLLKDHYDAVFAIDPSSLAFSKTSVPLIYYSDSVVSSMIDYYWFNVSDRSVKEANKVQKLALENSSKIILTNNWAKKSAEEDYGISPDKISIVHTGANVEIDDLLMDIMEKNNDTKEKNTINLLFCGADWERKGGDIAVETLRELNKQDKTRKYILHMYGCTPPSEIKDENIRIYGYLNRDNEEQRKIFLDLWKKADFFISPLKADCAAASFCDACAYGVPSITYDIGGIADHVINDYNGYRLPEGSSPSDFANKIIELTTDSKVIDKLKKNSIQLFKDDLNWEESGKKIRDIINGVRQIRGN